MAGQPEKPQDFDSVESHARYLAYLSRIKNVFAAGSRYLAYTSDVGEAFRPIVRPFVVNAAYGVSFLYVGADVAYEGYKSNKKGDPFEVTSRIVCERGVFQGLASLLVPAISIHTVVHLVHSSLKSQPASFFKKWGPSAAGLLVIPFLPMVDHPIEHSVQYCFNRFWPVKDHRE